MSLGPDRVQPMVQESASLGGQDPSSDAEPLVKPLTANNDALECAGIILQAPSETRDETVWVERDNGEVRLRDQKNTDRPSLSQLRTSFRWSFLLMGA